MNYMHTLTCLYLMTLNDDDDARYNSKNVEYTCLCFGFSPELLFSIILYCIMLLSMLISP